MARATPARWGEIILLTVFGAFIATFLIDVRHLPMEGKILSYVLAPPMVIFLLICTAAVVLPRKKSAENDYLPTELGNGAVELGETPAKKAPAGPAALGLGRTIAMGFVLFGCIYLFGFYFGSGLMLLAWFALFRRFTVATTAITVATPLLLYVLFEQVMPVGLYEGYIVHLLQR